jgi:prepilin-type N-terminal cleavage/methylation domain-containing protein
MLARLHKRLDKEEEGFTLIELLVVIIIIGILAAIAIPVFLSQRSKGYDASMKSDLRTVAQEVESANVDNQNYQSTFFNGTAVGTTGGAAIVAPSGNVGADANNKVRLSTGNTITWVAASTTAYCLKATSSKTSTSWYYSSDNGGLLPAGSTCTTTSI